MQQVAALGALAAGSLLPRPAAACATDPAIALCARARAAIAAYEAYNRDTYNPADEAKIAARGTPAAAGLAVAFRVIEEAQTDLYFAWREALAEAEGTQATTTAGAVEKLRVAREIHALDDADPQFPGLVMSALADLDRLAAGGAA
jgi:hypothetical protein